MGHGSVLIGQDQIGRDFTEWLQDEPAFQRARMRPGQPGRQPRFVPEGDQIKIEDDGSAAQKILDFLVERKLV